MIVEKDSATLGYLGEITKPLDADHHEVCKYINQQDSNYKSVRDVIRSMVERFRSKGNMEIVCRISRWGLPYRCRSLVNTRLMITALREFDGGAENEIKKVQTLLNTLEAPEDDLQYFLDRRMEGSSEWILSNADFRSWLDNMNQNPCILWLRGPPGAGKSILSAFLVQHFRVLGLNCQFYMFRYGNQTRTSLNSFLRSMAYQIAQCVPEYRRRLAKLSEDGFNAEKAESRVLWQKLFSQCLFGVKLSMPLYWVIDGLDEADSPQTLLNILSAISSSNQAIRLVFISRKSQPLSVAFERLATCIDTRYMSFDDSVQDLQFYVEQEIEFMHASPKLKDHITTTIMNMANGNFLWVHLVLKEVMMCLTKTDIDRALRELPAELEPLYARMELTLASHSRVSDKNLAKTILTWATCSKRPLTLQELSQALQPEYQPIIDLTHTINQVCGEFITVSAKGDVTMIHQTAREYLTKTSGLHFSVCPPEAHYALFQRSISFLSTSNPRIQAEQVKSQPFLLYAATSWAYHLRLSSAWKDRNSLLLLAKFFQRPSVLTWIYCLAVVGQLRVLVQASKTLTDFLERRATVDSEESPITHQIQEKEAIAQWAMDLVKIVGKFGTHLVAYPRSIYSLIPSLCPRDSVIHRRFGNKTQGLSSGLRLSGFSNNSWDDNLAKFSVGQDSSGISIKGLDNHFAILLTNGTVVLYHSMTCEESRRFRHGERVLQMHFNASGNKLVTYGYRTTKIWNVSSASEMECISNPPGTKALAITFVANDTAVLTCSEDRTIRQWSFLNPPHEWDVVLGDAEFGSNFHNSPTSVAFNHEGTQVALAYRGYPLSVWAVDFPGIIGKCERHGNVGHDLWTGVEKVNWNPVTGHVMGTYTDRCFFKWHPTENEYQESSVVALEIVCSPDGNLFVTTSLDGTLRIWNFHHFAMIYQLSCTSPVTDISFDPDCRRLYDLRESFCNVWEPNALIRLAEADEKASETSSSMGSSGNMSMASEMSAEMLEPITALAINPRSSAYCAGNDDGVLTLSNTESDEVVELSRGFMTVDHIVWSGDGTTLATADLSGRVIVKAVDCNHIPRERALSQTSAKDSVQQILLDHSGSHLLICTPQLAQLWSVGMKTLLANLTLPNSSVKWANHPDDKKILLCFGFFDIRMFHWADFHEMTSLRLDRTLVDKEVSESQPALFRLGSTDWPLGPDEFETFVDKSLTTPDRSIMLVQTSRASDHRRRRKQFMTFRKTDLTGDNVSSIITANPLPEHILSRIEIALGFVDSRRIKGFWDFSSTDQDAAVLVFLDKDFWVCTGLLTNDTGPQNGMKKHFFLPRDWLNIDCLELAAITTEGTFMCPRNGEVGIVRGGLRDEWVG